MSCYTSSMIPILRSTKFVLRPFRQSDARSLAAHIHDREIARNTANIPYPYTLKDARRWLEKTIKDMQERRPKNVNFAILVDRGVVGGIGLHNIKHAHKAEIGYWLARPYWGQGIMTQAVRLVMRYGFHRFKLKRIFAFTFPWNKGSQRVLLKAGFRREGLLKKNVKKGNKIFDSLIYAKVR